MTEQHEKDLPYISSENENLSDLLSSYFWTIPKRYDRESLPDNICVVVTVAHHASIPMQNSNGSLIRLFRFPRWEYETQIEVGEQEVRIAQAFGAAERPKYYLTTIADIRIPTRSYCIGKDFIFPTLPDNVEHDMAFHIFQWEKLSDSQIEVIFRGWFLNTEKLLNKVVLNSPLEWAILWYGRAAWIGNFIERFLSYWRTLEVLGHTMYPAGGREKGVKDKINYVLTKLTGHDFRNSVTKWSGLRNRLDHGVLSPKEYNMVINCEYEIRCVARKLLLSEILPNQSLD